MFEVSGLSVAYGHHPVLHDVSMTVGEGELVVVLGSNGAGKTTLINAISGMVRARKGTVVFRGEDITRMPAHSRTAEGIATVPQGRGLFPDMTVAENLELGAFVSSDAIATASHREHVFTLFPRLRERLRQPAETMSGGEQQMLAIGRALMSGPSLLLLDEPSLGLSPALTIDLFRAIRTIVDEGVSVLLVEQNARQSLKIADRAYLIEVGNITGSGSAEDIRADERVVAAYLGGRTAAAPATPQGNP